MFFLWMKILENALADKGTLPVFDYDALNWRPSRTAWLIYALAVNLAMFIAYLICVKDGCDLGIWYKSPLAWVICLPWFLTAGIIVCLVKFPSLMLGVFRKRRAAASPNLHSPKDLVAELTQRVGE